MKKLNSFISIGLIINAVWLTSSEFNLLPDFLEGLCAGTGIILILMGMYAGNHYMSRLRNFKRNLLSRAFGK